MQQPSLSQDENGTSLAVLHPLRETPERLAERIKAVRDVIAKDCTEQELYVFAVACQRTGLDPFSRQIYAIKRKNGMTIQTGIDGFRAIAEDSEKYRGQEGPFWCDADGVWVDVWLKPIAPVAAKVGVIREGFKETLWAVARTEAYRVEYNELWKKMPEVMIAKCAEALALRKAFPKKLSDVYTSEEMDQADAPKEYGSAFRRTIEERAIEERAEAKVVEAAVPPAKKVRKWATLAAQARNANIYETQEEWEAFIKRVVSPLLDDWASFDPKNPAQFDAVEQAIADKEAENAALEAVDLHHLAGADPLN